MPSLPPKKPRSWNVVRPPQSGRTFVNPWYNTQAWRKLRAAVLRDNPLCVECKKNNITTVAKVVDHIQNVSSGQTPLQREMLMWDVNNLQTMCQQCHNKKSGTEKFKK